VRASALGLAAALAMGFTWAVTEKRRTEETGRVAALERASEERSSARCPRALLPDRRAAEDATAAVRAAVPSAFGEIDTRQHMLRGVFSLSRAALIPELDALRYRKVAARACGARVARRSWAAVLTLPGAPDASLGSAVVFAASTERGWRAWYAWFPSKSRRGFFVK
jgi:hypothetical protein